MFDILDELGWRLRRVLDCVSRVAGSVVRADYVTVGCLLFIYSASVNSGSRDPSRSHISIYRPS